MMRKPVVVTVIGIAVLTFVALAALAMSSKSNYSFSQDRRTVMATKTPSFITPTNHEATLKTIAGNLSRYPFGVFFCCFGNTISGGGSDFLSTQFWVAIPFTPTANATVTRVEVSVGTFGGADAGAFRIQLLADNNNSPGNAIKTFNILTEPQYGACCTLDIGRDATGIPVTQGTQYWLAVTTSKTQTAFAGGWAFNSTDMRSHEIASWCSPTDTYCSAGGVWHVGQSGDPLPAYAVLGN